MFVNVNYYVKFGGASLKMTELCPFQCILGATPLFFKKMPIFLGGVNVNYHTIFNGHIVQLCERLTRIRLMDRYSTKCNSSIQSCPILVSSPLIYEQPLRSQQSPSYQPSPHYQSAFHYPFHTHYSHQFQPNVPHQNQATPHYQFQSPIQQLLQYPNQTNDNVVSTPDHKMIMLCLK